MELKRRGEKMRSPCGIWMLLLLYQEELTSGIDEAVHTYCTYSPPVYFITEFKEGLSY